MYLINEFIKVITSEMISNMTGKINTIDNTIMGTIFVITLIIGVLQCFFGYKLFKLWLSIIGFLVGTCIGSILCLTILDNVGTSIVIGIIFGIIVAFISVKIYYFGLFVLGSGISFLIAYIITSQNIKVSIVFALVIGIVTIFTAKVGVIIITSINGGTALSSAILSFLSIVGVKTDKGFTLPAALLAAFVFAMIGMFYQFKSNKSEKLKLSKLTEAKENKVNIKNDDVGSPSESYDVHSRKSEIDYSQSSKEKDDEHLKEKKLIIKRIYDSYGEIEKQFRKITNSKKCLIGICSVVILLSVVFIIAYNRVSHSAGSSNTESFKESFGGPQYEGNVVGYKNNTYIKIKDAIFLVDKNLKKSKKIEKGVTDKFIIYNNKIYFEKNFTTNNASDKKIWLCRCNLDGTDELKIMNLSSEGIAQIQIYEQYIYYKTYGMGNEKIGRVRIDGKMNEVIINDNKFIKKMGGGISLFKFSDFKLNQNKLFLSVQYYSKKNSQGESFPVQSIISVSCDGSKISKVYSTGIESNIHGSADLKIIDVYGSKIIFGMFSNERHDTSGKYLIDDVSFYSLNENDGKYKQIGDNISIYSYLVYKNKFYIKTSDNNYKCYEIDKDSFKTTGNLEKEYSNDFCKLNSTKFGKYYLWLEKTSNKGKLSICSTEDDINNKIVLNNNVPAKYDLINDESQNSIYGVANNIVYFDYTNYGDLAIMDINKKAIEYITIDSKGNIIRNQ